MTTVNLNLDKKTEKLFQELEDNTGVKREKFIASLVNGQDKLEDLKLLNKLLKDEKKPAKFYSVEEGRKILGF